MRNILIVLKGLRENKQTRTKSRKIEKKYVTRAGKSIKAHT